MASKKDLEAHNADLRELVGRAITEFDQIGNEAEAAAAGSTNGSDSAALIVFAHRARFVSKELESALEGVLDAEAVGLLTRLGAHWATKALAGGVLSAIGHRIGAEVLDAHVDSILNAANSILVFLGSSVPAPGGPTPMVQPSSGPEPSGVEIRRTVADSIGISDEVVGENDEPLGISVTSGNFTPEPGASIRVTPGTPTITHGSEGRADGPSDDHGTD